MSNFPIRRPRSPLAPPAYRMELTRRSAVGLTLSSTLAALLIFLSGLTIGVRLQFAGPVDEATPEDVAAGGGARPAESGFPALAGGGQALLTAPGVTEGSGGGAEAPAEAPAQAQPSEPPPPTGPSVPAIGDDAFVLQFGAFRVQENAERLRGQLDARGYAAEIRTTPGSAGAPLYRVVLGRFASQSVAGAAAERMRRDIGDEVYVMSEQELGW